VKRGDWVRSTRGRKTAHLVVAPGPRDGEINLACLFFPRQESIYVVDDTAPRCKKCLKAMEIAQRWRN